MQSLKNRKNSIELPRRDADSIVANREFPPIRQRPRAHVNFGRGVALELQLDADQVLEDLDQVSRVGLNGGERIMGHLGVTFTD